MAPKHNYAKVEEDSRSSSRTSLVMHEPKRPWKTLMWTAIAAAVLSSSFTIALMTNLSPHGFSATRTGNPHSHPAASTNLIVKPVPITPSSIPDSERPNCGTSLEEAKALGCEYDPLSVAWLPKGCPRDGTDEFVDFLGNGTKWKYWLDKEGTQEIKTPHEMAHIGKNGTYWTTQREHITHCAFMMLRVHRAMERGDGRGDMLVRKYAHSKHCLMYLVKLARGENDDRITTSGNVGFGNC